MSSPFPGMDPFLEDRRWWEVFYTAFIVEMMQQLNRTLPGDYFAASEQRLYLEENRRSMRPDVSVIAVPWHENNGGVAVMEAVDVATDEEPWEFEYADPQIIERYLQIIVAGDESRVVAVIELLSPANKASGSTGREEYLAKQEEVLNTDTHLVEIDLLFGGHQTVAVSPGKLAREGHYDYLVCLTPSHGTRHRTQTVWPIYLPKKLPSIRIPLGPGEPPVPLDLQAVFSEVYAKAAFAKRIDYRVPPAASLTQINTEWVAGWLKTKIQPA